MTRFGPRWASPLRAAVAVSALAVAAVTALFLAGLLSPGASADTGSFSVNNMVTRIRTDYREPCAPGTLVTDSELNSDISTGLSPSRTNPKLIKVSGNVSGCLATQAAPGYLLMDDPARPLAEEELFGYSTIAAKTSIALTAGLFPPSSHLKVANLDDQGDDFDANFLATSGQIYVDQELISYSHIHPSSDTVSGPSFHITTTPLSNHDSGSLVRAKNRLKLVARNQRTYVGGPPSQPENRAYDAGDTVRSPTIQLTCIGRLQQTSVAGLDPVVSRSRCYAVLEPGTPWPFAPIDAAGPWASTYLGPLLPLTPIFFHDLSTGTINDKNADGQDLVLTTDYLGIQCFPYIEGWLWTKIATTIHLDTNFNVGDEDQGEFRIRLYTDECSTELTSISPLGTGTNFSSIQAAEGALTPTPGQWKNGTDTDGDGCPDYHELGDRPSAGGLRDPFNPWDYFNNRNNGLPRSEDILFVVKHYQHDLGEPAHDGTGGQPNHPDHVAYNTKYDRLGWLGGAGYTYGPPNNIIRSDDILSAVKSYRHDCASFDRWSWKTATPTPKP